ncbi:MAG: class I SAM-dependent methyltransferase [Thermoleophilaceae bacterium]
MDNKDDKLTGERLMPEAQHGELVHAEHLARYLLAAQLAPGRRVLDVACGEGYGTSLLHESGAADAVGVDVDEPTIVAARERYSCDFRCADIAALPFDDDSFDLVVSFETIEHVSDAEGALSELARVLAPGGLLIVSTPNTEEYLVENEFHVREFSHEEFSALLRDRFASVRLLYQHNWLASAVLEEEGLREASGSLPLEVDLRKTVAREPGRELYTVALCGEETDVALAQVMVAAGTDEAHSLARRLVKCEETARTWHAEYEKAEDAAKLWHDTYKEQEQRTEDAWAHVHRMQESLSWRITRPLRIPARLRERRGR